MSLVNQTTKSATTTTTTEAKATVEAISTSILVILPEQQQQQVASNGLAVFWPFRAARLKFTARVQCLLYAAFATFGTNKLQINHSN